MIFDYPIILNLKNHLSITDIHNLSLTCKYYYGILNRIIKEIDLENLKNLEMLLIGILFSREEFEKVDLRLLEYVKIYKQKDPNIKKKPLEIFEIFKNYETNRDIKKLTFSNISNLQKYRFEITPDYKEFVLQLKLDWVLSEKMDKFRGNLNDFNFNDIEKRFHDEYGMKSEILDNYIAEFLYLYVGLIPPWRYSDYYDSDSDS